MWLAQTRSAAPAYDARMTSRTLRYSVGNEHNPSDPWGRSELLIRADGRAELEHHFARTGQARAWAGQVDAAALDELWAALGHEGFPAVTPTPPLPADATVRRLTVEADGAAHQARLSLAHTLSQPGYAAVFDLLDAVIRQLSGDAVAYPAKRGPVVHDAVAVR